MTLAAALCLLATGCGGDEGGPTPEGTVASPSLGGKGLLDGTTESPTPGGNGATQASPVEPGETPAPGEPTSAEYEIVARGTDPVDSRFTPQALLARSTEEGMAAADTSPAPGAGAVLRDWDEYGDRVLLAVLGGSQPDAATRLRLRAVNIVKNGALLIASGEIDRQKGPAAQVISIPWIVLALDPAATDTVERCTVSLEGATPFTTACK